MAIDSFRFLDPLTTRIIKAWIRREAPAEVPWTALPRPLPECKVALLSSAGVARHDDRPFDQDGERADPWWGDPTHRLIPTGTTAAEADVYHLHIHPGPARRDLNCVLPIDRLVELRGEGVIGAVAERHLSMMGYILDEAELLERTAPAMVAALREQAVDVVALVPV